MAPDAPLHIYPDEGPKERSLHLRDVAVTVFAGKSCQLHVSPMGEVGVVRNLVDLYPGDILSPLSVLGDITRVDVFRLRVYVAAATQLYVRDGRAGTRTGSRMTIHTVDRELAHVDRMLYWTGWDPFEWVMISAAERTDSRTAPPQILGLFIPSPCPTCVQLAKRKSLKTSRRKILQVPCQNLFTLTDGRNSKQFTRKQLLIQAPGQDGRVLNARLLAGIFPELEPHPGTFGGGTSGLGQAQPSVSRHANLNGMEAASSRSRMTTETGVDALIWGEADSGRRFLEKLLRAEGFSVEASSLLSEIVPPCMNRKYRMILVTLGFAESFDSKRVVERLRVVHEIDPLVPIVVVSGAISLEVERMLRREGIFYFLSRPFASSELIEAVRCAVRKRTRLQGGRPVE